MVHGDNKVGRSTKNEKYAFRFYVILVIASFCNCIASIDLYLLSFHSPKRLLSSYVEKQNVFNINSYIVAAYGLLWMSCTMTFKAFRSMR